MSDILTRKIYEGKDKNVYECENNKHLAIEYKDLTLTNGGTKAGIINNKGLYINKINSHIFQFLEDNGIPTHFVKELNDTITIVKKADMIPIELIVRNVVAGTLIERTGLPEGTVLSTPIIEMYYKRVNMENPMINRTHALALKLCNPVELDVIEYNAARINKILGQHLITQNITLVDFKVEFGRVNNRIVLADEISPDTCRFWDTVTGEKLDKDRFRQDLGNVEEAYIEICHRLMRA
ncbi:MAG: phosphoribosylaminoimidazolesuccinocarboxamide synthase [Clostridia bacterium]|nr:phosphoribosylaminoimidazolesuccinocarboxamide synthase [Clostridia bacterium]